MHIHVYTYILDDARALAACLPRQNHIYITTDELFRSHHNGFDEMPCKLDSTQHYDDRALAACLPHQDHIWLTTDITVLVRFPDPLHNNTGKFNARPCKLDSTENPSPRSFEKYLTRVSRSIMNLFVPFKNGGWAKAPPKIWKGLFPDLKDTTRLIICPSGRGTTCEIFWTSLGKASTSNLLSKPLKEAPVDMSVLIGKRKKTPGGVSYLLCSLIGVKYRV